MSSISVIIPTLNEEKNIGALLSDLEQQSLPASEIIVIDAGSSDKTVEVVSSFDGVRLIKSSPPVGAQRNLAGSQASSELLCYLDADTRVDSGFLASIIQEFERYKIDITCPIYHPLTTSFLTKIIYAFLNSLFFLFQKFLPSGAGSCIIVRAALFNQVGGFKGEYKFDDIEFIRRAARVGRFRQSQTRVSVSDRRFREYGNLRMLVVYAALSFLFCFGLHKLANKVSYDFANYKKA